jgi:HAD superfamily hydrolase (TIGR01549 family)
MTSHNQVRAVLFDLDDTLFDHRHSSRSGLAAVRERYPSLQQAAIEEVWKMHSSILEEIHLRVLYGEMTLDDAQQERMRRMFLHYGDPVSAAEEIANAAQCYRQHYQSARQTVPGSLPLLQSLHGRVRIAIVSNNMLDEQVEKLQFLGLASLVDVLVVSEEVGVAKPDPAIFREALKRIDCEPHEVVMVGDSWSADILGAQQLAIRSIWLNRNDIPCPDATFASEIQSFEPLESVLKLLLPPN